MLCHRCQYWDQCHVVFLLITQVMGQRAPSASLEIIKNLGGVFDQMVVLPFRDPVDLGKWAEYFSCSWEK